MSDTIPYTVETHPVTGVYNGKFGIWLFLASEVMLFGALFSSLVLLRVTAADWPHGYHVLNWPLATVNTMVLITSSVTVVMAWYSLMLGKLGSGRFWLVMTILLAFGFMVIKYFEYTEKFHHYQFTLNAPLTVEGYDEPVTAISGHLTDDSPHLEKNADAGVLEMPEHVMLEPDPTPGSHEHPHPIRIEKGQVAWVTNFGPSHSTFYATYFTMTGLHGLHVVGGIIVFAYLVGPGARMWRTDPHRYTNRIECAGLYWHFVDLVWIFLFPTLYLL